MYENDGLKALFRAMCGEENVIEHMEAEGQQKAIRQTRMAKKMQPSKETWEELGFTFTDIPYDTILYNATLPEGWSLQATEHSMWNNILGQNGMIRGKMFYKAAFYDRSAHMYLTCRYQICANYTGENYSTSEIYFGNDEEKLYVAGQVHTKENPTREEILAAYDIEKKLREDAENWANTNYPDWENINAYWDLPVKKDTKTKSKKEH